MNATDERKREVGRRAAELVENGMTIGLGTGSTADHFIDRLGERVQQDGLEIRGVPTSDRTAARAKALGIRLVSLADSPRLDLAVDGADQVDPAGDLIKGLGGALYREKLVAKAAARLVIIVDSGKMVDQLGVGCPVPVEVHPDESDRVASALRGLGASPELRSADGATYVTDNANWILDADFGAIGDPAILEQEINEIPGVVDNGIFSGLTRHVVIGEAGGIREWTPGAPGNEPEER